MRKNFINWKRQPFCSFCEICCPAAIMFMLVWIRTIISVVDNSAAALDLLKQPVFPGLYFDVDTGQFDPTQRAEIESMVEDFMNYDGYLGNQQGSNYELLLDFTGPLYFNPPNCKAKSYPNIPQQNATQVAIVDDGSDADVTAVLNMVTSYLTELDTFQLDLQKASGDDDA